MSEPNATALVPVAPPRLDSSGHTSGAELARITQGVDQRIAERQTALTSDMLPQSRGTSVPTTGKRQKGEPDRLTKDGKVSDLWMDWMISNLPHNKGKQAQRTQTAEIETVPGALHELYYSNYPAFEELMETAVTEYAPYFGYSREATAIDREYLAEIPHHLQPIIMSLPQEAADELLLMPEHVRNDWLEREYERQTLLAEQQVAADVQWALAERQGVETVARLTMQYDQAAWAELRKWQPRQNEYENETIRDDAMQGASTELLNDPYYAQMYQEAVFCLSNAPLRRFQGYSDGAEFERRGYELAKELNQELGRRLLRRIQIHGRGAGYAAPPAKLVGAHLKSLFAAA